MGSTKNSPKGGGTSTKIITVKENKLGTAPNEGKKNWPKPM